MMLLTERQRRGERHTLRTEVERCSQNVVYCVYFTSTEEGCGFVRPASIVCLTKMLGCFASVWMEEERNGNGKTILNMFLEHGAKVLVELVKERLLD